MKHIVITTALLDEIAASDLRKAAQQALARGQAVDLYVAQGRSGQRVDTLVADEERAGQSTGGASVWGDWSEARMELVLDDRGAEGEVLVAGLDGEQQPLELLRLNRELARLDPGGAVANPVEGAPALIVRVSDGNEAVQVEAAKAREALESLPDDASHEAVWAALTGAEVPYLVTYSLPVGADEMAANAVNAAPSAATLDEVREMCRTTGASAVLRDSQGFRRGSVDANGDYRLG